MKPKFKIGQTVEPIKGPQEGLSARVLKIEPWKGSDYDPYFDRHDVVDTWSPSFLYTIEFECGDRAEYVEPGLRRHVECLNGWDLSLTSVK